MKTENLLNRPIIGFASPRGLFRWLSAVKAGLVGPKNISFGRRVSLLRKGFIPKRQNQYGRDFIEHPETYLSDLQYYKGHPYNGFYSVWIDDKLTMRYIFSEHKDLLPRYFAWIDENGLVRPLSDCPITYGKTDLVAELARKCGVIALKALSASSGVGFYKVEYDGTGYLVNGERRLEKELAAEVASLRNYLISEYIVSREYLRKINPGSTNTIRVNIIQDGVREPYVVSGFLRFGTIASGSVDNGGAGGLVLPANVETGELLLARKFHPDGTYGTYTAHPDSKLTFPKQIEGWKDLCYKLCSLVTDYPQLRYMGFDIAQTDEGFKIIEINSLNDLYSVQLAGGILQDSRAAAFFGAR